MAKALQPPPFKTPFLDDKGYITQPWILWINAVQIFLNSTSTMQDLEDRIEVLE